MKETKIKKGLLVGLTAILAIGGAVLRARVTSANEVSRFEQKISDPTYELSVVMFYWSDSEIPKNLRAKVKSVKRVFKNVSDIQEYKQADVKFITVNLSKAFSLVKQFSLSDSPNEVTFMLFYQGAPYQNGNAKSTIHVTDKDLAREYIQALIEKHFGERIDAIIKRKEEIERERRPYYPRRYYGGYYYRPYGFGLYGFGHHGFGHGFRHRGGHHGFGHRGGHRGGGHRGGHGFGHRGGGHRGGHGGGHRGGHH